MSQTKGFFKEFREFAVRGNVVDLAVGVIVGAAFGKIVESIVKDIVMPLVNFVLGGSVDFTNKYLVLSRPSNYAGPETYAELTRAGATVFAWGTFVTIVISFVLLAFIIFWMVKVINTARASIESEKEKVTPPTPEDVALLREIRDLLKNKQ